MRRPSSGRAGSKVALTMLGSEKRYCATSSHARSSTSPTYAGFLALGEPMQTKTWTDFVARVASWTGTGVHDFIYEETSRRPDEPNEEGPTFVAEGD